jgi:hypothetical protein
VGGGAGVKVKLSLRFYWAPRHEGALGEWKYSSTYSLTSALDGGKWSASRFGCFTFGEILPVSSPPRPERFWGPPSLLFNGYQGLFPWG